MVNRLVSVGDDFKLPAAVKVEDGNLPTRLGATALNTTFGPTASGMLAAFALKGEVGGDQAHYPWLSSVVKAKTGTFKIAITGTSISSFDRSTARLVPDYLKTLHGDSGAYIFDWGVAGGSYAAAWNGWKKQVYGGLGYYRSVGLTTSTAVDFYASGNEVTVHWDEEVGSGRSEVLIDGVSAGFFGVAGGVKQAYDQKTTFATTKGAHKVTIVPPTTGKVYIKWLVIGDNDRKGVEVYDGTVGGTALWNAVTVRNIEGGQETPIPIVGNTGLDALTPTWADALLFEHIFNDTGAESAGGVFETAANYVVAKAKAQAQPILWPIEPGGGQTNLARYQELRTFLLGLRTNSHVTVIDWHGALWQGDYKLFMQRYYPITTTSESPFTFTGDSSHPKQNAYDVLNRLVVRELGMPAPPRQLVSDTRNDRLRTLPAGAGLDAMVTIAGVAERIPVPSGAAYKFNTPGSGDVCGGVVVPYYRKAGVFSVCADKQTAINASPTSDVYGKYEDWVNKSIGMGSTVQWGTGERAMFTMKASGTITMRVGADAKFYINGVVMPANSGTVTECRHVVGLGVEPVVFTVELGAPANFATIIASGRVYEVALTRSDKPLLT